MKPLPVRPLPVPAEPILDYLERLANANGYDLREFLTSFCGDEGLTEEALMNVLNGHPLPGFSGPVDSHIRIAVNTFGLKAVDFTHVYRRWCPACIELGGWIRPIWRLKTATICPIHCMRLLQVCPGCGSSRPDLESILRGTCVCGTRFIQVNTPISRQELLISQSLVDSLVQKAVLDLGELKIEIDAPQLIRLIFYTGQFHKGPSLTRPGKIRDLEDLSVASDILAGTAKLLADWPSVFWRCLERFVEAAPHDASVRRVFGPLYHVIYHDLRDATFQFLRDAFELFLLEHWRGELCGRHRLFNPDTIEEHRYQGLTRVARTHGVGGPRLRKMVHQSRFPVNHFDNKSKREKITIDANLLGNVLPDPADYMDLRSVARLFGLKRNRLRQLIAHGAILADAKPDFARSNHWHFRKSEVLGLLDELRQRAMSLPSNGDFVSLNHVLRYWRVSAAELGALIRVVKRHEIDYGLPPNCCLSEMTFLRDDLRAWLTKNRDVPIVWVSVSQAAKLLQLKEQVVYELVSRNFLVADVAISSNGYAARRIAMDSLQTFEQEYISLVALSKRQNTSSKALLAKIIVKPVTGPNVDGGRQYFYKHADLEKEVSGGNLRIKDEGPQTGPQEE